ncbi:MAG: hypothetical protein WDN69_10850 [Aliidongia sp.]
MNLARKSAKAENNPVGAPSEALLRVESLAVDYATAKGLRRAVEDVSFTLGRNEVLGLAGESGLGQEHGRLRHRPAAQAAGLHYRRLDPARRRRRAAARRLGIAAVALARGQRRAAKRHERAPIRC